MRNWYSAQDLAGLPGMPSTVQGISYRAKRESWECQLRLGQGGGREYAFAILPKETQTALITATVVNEAPQQVIEPHVILAGRDAEKA